MSFEEDLKLFPFDSMLNYFWKKLNSWKSLKSWKVEKKKVERAEQAEHLNIWMVWIAERMLKL